jgi:hypothetical protein
VVGQDVYTFIRRKQREFQKMKETKMWTTKKLVVGQEVFIFDRAQNGDIGRVIEISPSGDVEINVCDKLFLRFDRNVGPGQHPSLEYGPWFIDDMPFEERLAHQNEFPWRDIRSLL